MRKLDSGHIIDKLHYSLTFSEYDVSFHGEIEWAFMDGVPIDRYLPVIRKNVATIFQRQLKAYTFETLEIYFYTYDENKRAIINVVEVINPKEQ